MKKIWIYFSNEAKFGYPFHKREYLESYYNLVKDIEENNDIKVYIVRWNSYEWKWVFSNSFIFDFTKKDINLIETWKIKVDLIFNRDNENTIPKITDCKIINDPEFDEICVDKLKTFQKFPHLSPKTAYINSFEECIQQIKEFDLKQNDIIVLKKNFETEGNWIFIWEINKISKDTYSDWTNILFQEFIDSSIWIANITTWLHDIRLSVVNWKITNCLLRIPCEWSYLANISRWWSSKAIKVEDVPENLISLAKKISLWFKKYYPIVFSCDFVNSKNWFKLIELNSRPGLSHPNWSEDYYKFNNAIRDMLIEAVK